MKLLPPRDRKRYRITGHSQAPGGDMRVRIGLRLGYSDRTETGDDVDRGDAQRMPIVEASYFDHRSPVVATTEADAAKRISRSRVIALGVIACRIGAKGPLQWRIDQNNVIHVYSKGRQVMTMSRKAFEGIAREPLTGDEVDSNRVWHSEDEAAQ